MANIIPEAIHKAQHAVMGNQGNKVADLEQETKEVSSKARLTTDYGVKQTSADDWLKVVSQDKTGPMLLEDPFGREKVGRPGHASRDD
jgi:catalase